MALGGVTGAVVRMTGGANTSIDFGDYADITSHGLVVTADNNLTKSGLDDNFKFDGGGAISITIGDSRTRHAQNALVDFGDNSNAVISGSKTDNQDAVITSRVNIVADDEAIINTGALVGVPVSDTQIIANPRRASIWAAIAAFTHSAAMSLYWQIRCLLLMLMRAHLFGGWPVWAQPACPIFL